MLGRDDGLRLVGRRGETDGILVDPAGPSDSCRLPVTAISNHNGQAGEEVRLTCVVQRDTGLPLLFRHVAGNAIDVSTITRTIAALGAMCFGPRFPPQSRSIKSITHFTMPSVSRSTKGYSSIQITMLASEEFSHIQSGDNRQSRSADSGQCAGSRLPNLCSGYTPLGCIPLTFVACGTASTE